MCANFQQTTALIANARTCNVGSAMSYGPNGTRSWNVNANRSKNTCDPAITGSTATNTRIAISNVTIVNVARSAVSIDTDSSMPSVATNRMIGHGAVHSSTA